MHEPHPTIRRLPAGTPSRGRWTPDEIRALGTTTDAATAASVLGIGRSLAYELLRQHRFPVPVIRAGTRIVVPVAALLTILRLDDPPAPTGRLDLPAVPRVDRRAADYPATDDDGDDDR